MRTGGSKKKFAINRLIGGCHGYGLNYNMQSVLKTSKSWTIIFMCVFFLLKVVTFEKHPFYSLKPDAYKPTHAKFDNSSKNGNLKYYWFSDLLSLE